MQNGFKLMKAEVIYKNDPNLKKQDVINLQEWLKHQPHLPEITEEELLLFLHSCYYSNEATKKCIDNFYTIRTHTPEFFHKLDLKDPKIILTLKSFFLGPLPKLTPEGYVVLHSNMVNCNVDNYFFDSHVKVFDTIAHIFLRENGIANGYVVVLNFEGTSFTHFLKTPPLSVKKLMHYVQESLPVRLKQIHLINPPPFMDKIVGLIKMFANKAVSDMIYVHQNTSVFDMIPKECLPNESGGTLGPVREFMEKNISILEKNAKFLRDFEDRKVDESKRPGKPKNSGEIYGIEGTFKKLDLD